MNTPLEKIHKAAVKFLVPLNPVETYKLIVDEATKLVKADYGHILLFQDNDLKRVYATDPIFFKIKNRRRGFMFNVFRKRRSIILALKDVTSIHPLMQQIKIKSIVGIPLSYRNKSIGVLGLLSKKRNFFSEKK